MWKSLPSQRQRQIIQFVVGTNPAHCLSSNIYDLYLDLLGHLFTLRYLCDNHFMPRLIYMYLLKPRTQSQNKLTESKEIKRNLVIVLQWQWRQQQQPYTGNHCAFKPPDICIRMRKLFVSAWYKYLCPLCMIQSSRPISEPTVHDPKLGVRFQMVEHMTTHTWYHYKEEC